MTGQTDGQINKSDFIGHRPTNVERPIVKYRDYSNFCKKDYSQHILKEMSNGPPDNSFSNICKEVLDYRALIKRKSIVCL